MNVLAVLRDLIKMAEVVVTLRVMPESPDVDLGELERMVLEKIKDEIGETETKVEREAIGFGLSALKVIFVMDENRKVDPVEETVSKVEGVQSVDVVDVRRAIG